MLHRLLKLLFPSPCLNCGYLSEALCFDCEKDLKFQANVRDLGCLKICSPLLYKKQSLIEQIIESFKYKHQYQLKRPLAVPMVRCFRLFIADPHTIFVPVPLHPRRERERGYNQAQLLAEALAKEMGLSCLPLLKRRRHTAQQARLRHRKDREENLKGAFVLQKRPPPHSQVVLVDDIVTTGSTLLECKAALEAQGIPVSLALTLANRDERTPYPWN